MWFEVCLEGVGYTVESKGLAKAFASERPGSASSVTCSGFRVQSLGVVEDLGFGDLFLGEFGGLGVVCKVLKFKVWAFGACLQGPGSWGFGGLRV